MKKVFILSIAAFGLFASCKKSSSPSAPPSGISATINGTSKSFNTAPFATKLRQSGIDEIIVYGALASGETISVMISNQLSGGIDSIVTGSYPDTSTRFSVAVGYQTGGASSVAYGGGTSVDGSQGSGTGTNHVVVNISSITSSSIIGTFSGNIYLNGDPAAASWPVTNGSFNVGFK
jgi:hypothetical protein